MCAEGVEEVDVLATQLDVLEAIAVAQGVISDIEYMIGFVIGQVNLEQMQLAVDGVDETDAARQKMKDADAGPLPKWAYAAVA